MGQSGWECELLFDDAHSIVAGRGPVPLDIFPEQPVQGSRGVEIVWHESEVVAGHPQEGRQLGGNCGSGRDRMASVVWHIIGVMPSFESLKRRNSTS